MRADGIRSHDIPSPFDSLHTELLSNRASIETALTKRGVASSHATNEGTLPVLTIPDKPSIALLLFNNMTGDPDHVLFGDGIDLDSITMLSRSRSLFVIARNSSFTYKGRAVDVKQAMCWKAAFVVAATVFASPHSLSMPKPVTICGQKGSIATWKMFS